MCGRIGGVSGSSIVGLLLDNNCTLILYTFSGVAISKFDVKSRFWIQKIELSSFVLVCALVFMMIKIKSQ